MKVIGYCALLYGREYLFWAIRSVIDYIDEFHVIYDQTGHGSHGHVTDRECPDKRSELISEATRAAGDKLRWHDAGPFAYEGQQRDSIHQYAPDADIILVVDADELWPESFLQMLRYNDYKAVSDTGDLPKRWRLPMIHFWRSFYRAILHDPAYPERVIFPHGQRNEAWTCSDCRPICHMGYAQRSDLVEFKQHTHGHKDQWRQDDWFHSVFMANAQANCHPVGSDYWTPERVNPWDYMPAFMTDHPYANLEVIP